MQKIRYRLKSIKKYRLLSIAIGLMILMFAIIAGISCWTLYSVIEREGGVSVETITYVRRSVAWMVAAFVVMLLISSYVLKKGSSALAYNVKFSSYGSIAEIYTVMCMVNLDTDTVKMITRDPKVTMPLFHGNNHANEQIHRLVGEIVSLEYVEMVNEFADLTTLKKRLKNKKAISCEFVAKEAGWCRARYIVDKEYNPNKIQNVILAIEWIDEEKRRQERLRRKSEENRLANEAKSRFLANMSHEIRTPINAVLGFDEMILRESKEPRVREYAMDIESAGRTLLSLINDVLDWSKIESGKMEIIPADYELASLLHDALNLVLVHAQNKHLDIKLIVDEHLPSVLYGDDLRIRQILINLLSNAIKYTDQGSVTLKVDGTVENDTVQLHFEVQDTGIGIKQEEIKKIFDAFERIDKSRNRYVEGTGLGLNISMRLLALMNSKLSVESVYGEGSIFSFDLQQKVVEHEKVGNVTSQNLMKKKEYVYEVSFVAPQARILVVDDSAVNRKVLLSLLRDMQMHIDEAVDGKDALQKIIKEKYDIIFLDHMMPEMDGIQVLEEMRHMHTHPNQETPVVVVTANAISGAREDYLAKGFDAYIAKPLDMAKLGKIVEQFLADTKKLELSEKKVNQDKKAKEDVRVLGKIEGVDWDYALSKLGTVSLLREMIDVYLMVAYSDLEELQNLYKCILDATQLDEKNQAFEQYCIKVHGMKSATAVIGALNVSSLARMLEFAAREKNQERIEALMGIFVEQWIQLRKKLEEEKKRV